MCHKNTQSFKTADDFLLVFITDLNELMKSINPDQK